MSSPASTQPQPWSSLNQDLQELVLSHLPVSSALLASSVCKQWHSAINSPHFASQQARLGLSRRPWFYILGINELIHVRSQAFAFDLEAEKWIRLPLRRPPDFNRTSLSAMDGLLFASSGPNFSRVAYASSPLNLNWKETSASISTRCSMLVGVIGHPGSGSFKFIVAGGILDGTGGMLDRDQRMVEMYDSVTDSWEVCPPLPEDLNGGRFSQWMSSAVCKGNLYVSEIHSGDIAAFDVQNKVWGPVHTLNLPDVFYSFIVACFGGLYAAGVCNSVDGRCLKLWKVDEANMECEEVSTMPSELFSLFENEDEERIASFKCVGAGNLVYAYNESHHKGYPVCVCELNDRGSTWKQLPPLPSPLHRFDRVVCCTTFVTPQACSS